MASAWGSAWNVYWGVSWGDPDVAPIVPPVEPSSDVIPTGAGSGMSSRIDYEEREKIAAEVRELYEQVYRDKDRVPSEAVEEAVEVVEDLTASGSEEIPAPYQIDWIRLTEDQVILLEFRLRLYELSEYLDELDVIETMRIMEQHQAEIILTVMELEDA